MKESVALCLDTATRLFPGSLGLQDEKLDQQKWLQVFTQADDMRDSLRRADASVQAWVAASDDMEAINVAAALKGDCANRRVYLLAPGATGSLRSRAAQAHVDGVWDEREVARRYAGQKMESQFAIETVSDVVDTRSGASVVNEGAFASKDTAACNSQGFSSSFGGRSGALAEVGSASAPGTAPASMTFSAAPYAAAAAATALAIAPGRDATRGFLLPVVSGGGGVGKSTLAALCGVISQCQGRNTVVVDCDLQFGDLALLLGLPSAPTFDDVAASSAVLSGLASVGRMPALVAAPRKLEQSEAVVRDSTLR